jgi:hypothetical protein
MAAKWSVSGNYFETCNCDVLCPCISSNLTAKPTKGDCKFAAAFQIEKGSFDGVPLNGLSFVVLAMTPGPMMEGKMTVGVVVDEKANEKQREAILGIASGQAGGPMANLGPLVGTFAGMEARPIVIKREGKSWSVTVKGMIEQSVEPIMSQVKPDEPLYIDNTMHPANSRLALGKSKGTMFNAFGIKWDHPSGGNNGHIAPFSWTGG